MSITAKKLIELLQKCDPSAIVLILDEDEVKLKFVEFCPASNTISLQRQEPDLTDTVFLDVEILEREDSFAITKCYDVEGFAY